MSDATSWTYLKDMLAYLKDPNVKGMYGMWDAPDPGLHANGTVTPGEGGVDLTAPTGTPVYALSTGPIKAMGYWKDKEHGVVTQTVNVPGKGPQDLYYQHIYIDPSISQGQMVQKGQKIGVVGGYGETELGFNASWGGIYGNNHPGPWAIDPRPMLQALMTDTSTPVAPGAGSATSFNPLDPSTWWPSIAPTVKQWGEYIGVFILALVLVVVGFFLLAEKEATQAAKTVAKVAMV